MTKLKKSDLLKLVAERADQPSSRVATILEAYHKVVVEETTKGNVVQFPGFGSYQVNTTKARMGINPATKERIQIPAGRRFSFKAAKALKDSLKHS